MIKHVSAQVISRVANRSGVRHETGGVASSDANSPGSRAVAIVPLVILLASRFGTSARGMAAVEKAGGALPPDPFPNQLPSGTFAQSTVIVPVEVTGPPLTVNSAGIARSTLVTVPIVSGRLAMGTTPVSSKGA